VVAGHLDSYGNEFVLLDEMTHGHGQVGKGTAEHLDGAFEVMGHVGFIGSECVSIDRARIEGGVDGGHVTEPESALEDVPGQLLRVRRFHDLPPWFGTIQSRNLD
jgi:hypothetical protein